MAEVAPRRHIAQIGPWPPPFGGISVYMQRLSRACAAAGHRVTVYETDGLAVAAEPGLQVVPLPPHWSRFLSLGQRLAADGVDVAQLHLVGLPGDVVAPAWASCAAAGVPLAVSVHSLEPDPAEPAARRRAALLATPRLRQAFASGAHVAEGLKARGLVPGRVLQVPPFVRPPPPATPTARLPRAIVALRARSPFLIAGGATAMQAFAGGDLYGADVFVALARAVAARRDDVAFVFQLTRRGDAALYADLCRALAEADLGGRLLLHEALLEEASDLWRIADIYVRTSRTDGDAVSVREALDAGTPTLASDCVARPAAVVPFRSGDGGDAAAQVFGILSDLAAARARVAAAREPDGAATVIATLERLAASSRRLDGPLRASAARVQPWLSAAVSAVDRVRR